MGEFVTNKNVISDAKFLRERQYMYMEAECHENQYH